MEKVCVIIRVYDRMEDLENCIDIIRDTWKLFDYHIIVVANGSGKGYTINTNCKQKINKLVNLESNAGHIKGNSQLLLEGLPFIPDDCAYSILLEADTWLFGDDLIKKYIDKLIATDAVWASAQFFSYKLSLATDFAIVKSSFIKDHNAIVNFDDVPEYYVAQYLKSLGLKNLYLSEIMPVNLPRYIKKYPYAPTGRFFVFPDAKMATHHIENLAGGMDEKKFYFNVVANQQYFVTAYKPLFKNPRLLIKAAMFVSYVFPQTGWISRSK